MSRAALVCLGLTLFGLAACTPLVSDTSLPSGSKRRGASVENPTHRGITAASEQGLPPENTELSLSSGSLQPQGPDQGLAQGLGGNGGLDGTASPEQIHSRTEPPESLDQRLKAFLSRSSPKLGVDSPSQGEVVGLFVIAPPEGDLWGAVVVSKSGGVGVVSGGEPSSVRPLYDLGVKPDFAAISNDFSILAIASGPAVELFDALSGASLGRFKGNRARVTSLDWAPDRGSVLIGAADGRIYRWRRDKGLDDLASNAWNREFERYIGHAASVSAVRYHPLGRLFFSGDWDGELSAWLDYTADPFGGEFDVDILGGRFFTAKTPRVVGVKAGKRESIDALALSDDGGVIAAALQNGALEVWKTRGFSVRGAAPAEGGMVYGMALSGDGRRAATVGRDNRVRLYSIGDLSGVERGAITKIGEIPITGVRRLAFIKNGDLLGGTNTGKVVVIRPAGIVSSGAIR